MAAFDVGQFSTRIRSVYRAGRRRRAGHWARSALLLIAFLGPCCQVGAQSSGARSWLGQPPEGSVGTADPAAKRDALRAIPYDRLRPEVGRQIHAVVSQPTVYRRLPITSIDCDPDLFVFLIRNPEVVVNIWEVMGVTQIDLQRTDRYRFTAHDGMGTVSNVDLAYGTPNTHVYFGRGVYEGSLLKAKVFGQCVMLLRSAYFHGPDGRPKVRNVLDVFLKLDSAAVDLVARTCQPLFVKAADTNFVETASFLTKLSRTAELNPIGVVDLAGKLSDVQPQVRSEFADLARHVSDQHQARRSVPQAVRVSAHDAHVQRRARPVSLVTSDLKPAAVSRRYPVPPTIVR